MLLFFWSIYRDNDGGLVHMQISFVFRVSILTIYNNYILYATRRKQAKTINN